MKYNNLNTLLISTDFSQESYNAINYATEMALRLGLKIHLFHTIPLPQMAVSMGTLQYGSIYPDVVQQSELKAKKRLEDICLAIRKQTNNVVNCSYEINKGDQAENVIQKMEENSRLLSVIGIEEGLTSWDMLLGNTAIEVMRKGFFPTMIIPEYAAFRPVDNILYATDDETRDIEDLMSLISVSRVLNAKLHIVSTHRKENTNNPDFADFIDTVIDHSAYQKIYLHLLTEQNAGLAENIKGFLKSIPIDLLAMQAKNKSFWGNLFQPGESFKVALNTDIPLLVFHNE